MSFLLGLNVSVLLSFFLSRTNSSLVIFDLHVMFLLMGGAYMARLTSCYRFITCFSLYGIVMKELELLFVLLGLYVNRPDVLQ